MKKTLLALLTSLCGLAGATACINLPDTTALLPVGTPFVVRGTMTLQDDRRPCPVWLAENGTQYYLYQDALLDNSTYDRVVTPGATSRLVLATRSDLAVPCDGAVAAEVQNVLEIVE